MKAVDPIPISQHSHRLFRQQRSTFEWEHISLLHKMVLTVLKATSSMQLSLPSHWHNVCLLNPLSRGQSDDNLKVLNLVSMEDAAKLSTRMRRLSLLYWCFSVVEHCHAEGGHYRLARSNALEGLKGEHYANDWSSNSHTSQLQYSTLAMTP